MIKLLTNTFHADLRPPAVGTSPHAEGYFVVPMWWRIGLTYSDALGIIVRAIRERYDLSFDFDVEAVLHDESAFVLNGDALAGLKTLAQSENAAIVPAQFGLNRLPQSGTNVQACLTADEFMIDALTGLCMLFVAPERLRRADLPPVEFGGCAIRYPHRFGRLIGNLSVSAVSFEVGARPRWMISTCGSEFVCRSPRYVTGFTTRWCPPAGG